MLVGFGAAVVLDAILTLSIWNRVLCMEPGVCMEKNEYKIRMFLGALKLLGLIGIILGLIIGFIVDIVAIIKTKKRNDKGSD